MIRKHKYDYDLIVLGSGAGGSVGANYAHSLGKKVAVFEKAEIGGECPNWACVPTKALLRTARIYQLINNSSNFGIEVKNAELNITKIKKWRELVVSRTGSSHGEEIFKKEGLHLIKAKADFVSNHEVEADGKVYSADKFILATGTKVAIPPIPGLEKTGYITFKEAGNPDKIHDSLFILGAGAVGCEFAQIYSTFGSKVTIADSLKNILFREDEEVSELIQALFENQGVEVLTDVLVTKVEKKGNSKIIHYSKGDHNHKVSVEEILIATGKKPLLDFAPEKAGIKVENNKLVVNKFLQTSSSHIYAAGDIIGPFQFTHTGEYQSYIAASNAFSYRKKKVDYSAVTRCVFTDPEVASVGVGEKQLKDQKISYKVGITPIAQLGRANTSNEFDGFVKVITNKNENIVGASIVSPRAGEVIHELALAIKLNVKAKVLAELIHAYPTFSEAIKFACSSLVSKK